jgi:hypothetical protein
VLAAVVVRSVFLRDSARAVPTEEVIDVFRASTSTSEAAESTTEATATTTATTTSIVASTSTSAAAATAPPLVEQGIYRYNTTGGENIDALDGATHDYPPETTITAVAGGCGVRLRWDALRERRDEWALCSTPDGIELQPDGVQYHEFFGQPDDEAVSCDRAVLVVPVAAANPGGVQSPSCTLADDPWLPSWEVLERTARSIAGTEIEVQHVRMTVDDNDEYWEHTVVDWYLAATGLPVEVVCTKESKSPSPIGAVTYREQYNLQLVSTTPLR